MKIRATNTESTKACFNNKEVELNDRIDLRRPTRSLITREGRMKDHREPCFRFPFSHLIGRVEITASTAFISCSSSEQIKGQLKTNKTDIPKLIRLMEFSIGMYLVSLIFSCCYWLLLLPVDFRRCLRGRI